jgi:hypothetical protein
VDCIIGRGPKEIVVLRHSFGGSVISKVVEAMAERIGRLVFLKGFVLEDGNRLTEGVARTTAAQFVQMGQNSSDNTFRIPFPVWRERFTSDGSSTHV